MFQKRIHIWGWGVLFLALALLSSCTPTDLTPPTLSITSPAPNSPVSGTVAVLVNAVDDMSVSSVDLYVRGKGSLGRGVFVNSAVGSSPFVINWNSSANMPNQSELELVAVAKDASGNESESPAIAVKTQNTGTPSLQLLTAYSFASDPLLEGRALQSAASGLVTEKRNYIEGSQQTLRSFHQNAQEAVSRMREGLQSAMTYVNAQTLSEFRQNVRFAINSHAVIIESGVH